MLRPILALTLIYLPLTLSALAADSKQDVTIPMGEQEKSVNDLNDTLTQARQVPNFESGQPAGYKVIKESGETYQNLGLKNGDVIQGDEQNRAPAQE